MSSRGRDPLTWIVVATTTVVWIMTAGAGVITGEFRLFEFATGPYLLVVGYVTGAQVLRRGNGYERPDDREERDRWSHLP